MDKKKPSKPRADKYEKKLVLKGTFSELIKVIATYNPKKAKKEKDDPDKKN